MLATNCGNRNAQCQHVRRYDRLAAQCLPGDEPGKTEVGCAAKPYQLGALAPAPAARGPGAGKGKAEQRQDLHGVEAEEMADAQVAADGAPAYERQAWPAVGNPTLCAPTSVSGWPAWAAASCAGVGPAVMMITDQHAGKRDEYAQAHRPRQHGVGQALEDEPDADHEVQDGHERDEHTHGREDGSVKRRGDVEVAGRPAHDLQ